MATQPGSSIVNEVVLRIVDGGGIQLIDQTGKRIGEYNRQTNQAVSRTEEWAASSAGATQAVMRQGEAFAKNVIGMNSYKSGLDKFGDIAFKFNNIASQVEPVREMLTEKLKVSMEAGMLWSKWYGNIATVIEPTKAAMEAAAAGVEDLGQKTENQLKAIGAAAEGYIEGLREIIKSSPLATEDMLKGGYDVLSAGFTKSADAATIFTEANKLAVVSLGSSVQAVDTLTSMLNSYGLKANQAASVANAIVIASQAGKLTLDEFNTGIGKVAPTAAQLGASLPEVTAAIATITDYGIPAAEAQTNLRMAMVALLKPTKEMTGLIKDLGFNSGEAMIKQLGLRGTLQALAAATQDDAEKFAKAFSRVQGMSAGDILGSFSLGGARYNEVLAKTQEAMASAGTQSSELEKRYKLQTETVWALGERTKKLYEELKRSQFEEFAKPLKDIMIKLIEFGDWWDKLGKSEDPMQRVIKSSATWTVLIVAGLASITSAVLFFASRITLVIVGLQTAFGWLDKYTKGTSDAAAAAQAQAGALGSVNQAEQNRYSLISSVNIALQDQKKILKGITSEVQLAKDAEAKRILDLKAGGDAEALRNYRLEQRAMRPEYFGFRNLSTMEDDISRIIAMQNAPRGSMPSLNEERISKGLQPFSRSDVRIVDLQNRVLSLGDGTSFQNLGAQAYAASMSVDQLEQSMKKLAGTEGVSNLARYGKAVSMAFSLGLAATLAFSSSLDELAKKQDTSVGRLAKFMQEQGPTMAITFGLFSTQIGKLVFGLTQIPKVLKQASLGYDVVALSKGVLSGISVNSIVQSLSPRSAELAAANFKVRIVEAIKGIAIAISNTSIWQTAAKTVSASASKIALVFNAFGGLVNEAINRNKFGIQRSLKALMMALIPSPAGVVTLAVIATALIVSAIRTAADQRMKEASDEIEKNNRLAQAVTNQISNAFDFDDQERRKIAEFYGAVGEYSAEAIASGASASAKQAAKEIASPIIIDKKPEDFRAEAKASYIMGEPGSQSPGWLTMMWRTAEANMGAYAKITDQAVLEAQVYAGKKLNEAARKRVPLVDTAIRLGLLGPEKRTGAIKAEDQEAARIVAYVSEVMAGIGEKLSDQELKSATALSGLSSLISSSIGDLFEDRETKDKVREALDNLYSTVPRQQIESVTDMLRKMQENNSKLSPVMKTSMMSTFAILSESSSKMGNLLNSDAAKFMPLEQIKEMKAEKSTIDEALNIIRDMVGGEIETLQKYRELMTLSEEVSMVTDPARNPYTAFVTFYKKSFNEKKENLSTLIENFKDGLIDIDPLKIAAEAAARDELMLYETERNYYVFMAQLAQQRIDVVGEDSPQGRMLKERIAGFKIQSDMFENIAQSMDKTKSMGMYRDAVASKSKSGESSASSFKKAGQQYSDAAKYYSDAAAELKKAFDDMVKNGAYMEARGLIDKIVDLGRKSSEQEILSLDAQIKSLRGTLASAAGDAKDKYSAALEASLAKKKVIEQRMALGDYDTQDMLTQLFKDKKSPEINTLDDLASAYNSVASSLNEFGQSSRANIASSRTMQYNFDSLTIKLKAYQDEQSLLPQGSAEWSRHAAEIAKTSAAIEAVQNKMMLVQTEEDNLVTLTGKKFVGSVASAGDIMNQIANRGSQAIGDFSNAIVDWANGAKISFADMTKSILADLTKMMLQMALMNMVKAGLGALGMTNANSAKSLIPVGGEASVDSIGNLTPIAGSGTQQGPFFGMPAGASLSAEPKVTINNYGSNEVSVNRKRGPGGEMELEVAIKQIEGGMTDRMSRGAGLAPYLESQYGMTRTPGRSL